jgi:hypothetical protein
VTSAVCPWISFKTGQEGGGGSGHGSLFKNFISGIVSPKLSS